MKHTFENSGTTLIGKNAVFRELVESQCAVDPAGNRHPVHSAIRLACADALYRTGLAQQPQMVIEIGMAFGVSTLAILTALEEIGGDGQLISLDPWQAVSWHNCGLAAVERAGLGSRHRLIETFDYLALPELLRATTRIDLAYIDGYHTFDYVLMDFWYLDKLLRVGGLIGFNDCDWPAVHKAIGFVRSHRKYTEVDVGLAPRYTNYSRPRELWRRLRRLDRPTYYRNASDRYFKKTEDWEPRWDFFAPF